MLREKEGSWQKGANSWRNPVEFGIFPQQIAEEILLNFHSGMSNCFVLSKIPSLSVKKWKVRELPKPSLLWLTSRSCLLGRGRQKYADSCQCWLISFAEIWQQSEVAKRRLYLTQSLILRVSRVKYDWSHLSHCFPALTTGWLLPAFAQEDNLSQHTINKELQ